MSIVSRRGSIRPTSKRRMRTRYSRRNWHARVHSDLLCGVLLFLPPRELTNAAAVSKAWQTEATRNWIWTTHCESVWAGKLNVSATCQHLRVTGRSRETLVRSVAQGAARCIRAEEPCSKTFHFRFKEDAGEEWRAHDPFWSGHPARTLRFCMDGKVTWGSCPGAKWHGFYWELAQRTGEPSVAAVAA